MSTVIVSGEELSFCCHSGCKLGTLPETYLPGVMQKVTLHNIGSFESVQLQAKAWTEAYIQDLLPCLPVWQVTEDAAAESAQHSFVQVLRPVGSSENHHLRSTQFST